MNGEILTPASPRWIEFMVRLTSPPYLDFHFIGYHETTRSLARKKKSYHIDRNLAWRCSHDKSKPVAFQAMAGMVGLDLETVEATLAQWPDLCDCELVFNVGNEEEEE